MSGGDVGTCCRRLKTGVQVAPYDHAAVRPDRFAQAALSDRQRRIAARHVERCDRLDTVDGQADPRRRGMDRQSDAAVAPVLRGP